MTYQDQSKQQLLTNAEQHQLDGGVYYPDMHILPPFQPGPVDPTDPTGRLLIRIDLPLMMTHGVVPF